MKNNVKALALAGVLITGSAFASEYRTPYLSERGPLRYDFFKLPKEEDCSWWFNMWSSVYYKESHKAFLKHGTNTEPLTALIFNKSEFQFQDAFYNGTVNYDAENYNPFFKILTYKPRVEHQEKGMNIGGKFEMSVWGKGRVGVRFNVPFRKVELERKDDTDKLQDPRDQVVSSRYVTIDRSSLGMKANTARDVYATVTPLIRALTSSDVPNLINDLVNLKTGQSANIGAFLDLLINETEAVNSIGGDLTVAGAAINGRINQLNRSGDLGLFDNVKVTAYRSDFVRNIIDVLQQSEVKVPNSDISSLVTMFTVPVSAVNQPAGDHGVAVALVGSNAIGEPLMHAFQQTDDPGDAMNRNDLSIGRDNIKPISSSTSGPSAGTLGYFELSLQDDATDYSKVLSDWEKQLRKCECPNGDGDSKYWVIFRRQTDAPNDDPGKFGRGVTEGSGTGRQVADEIENRLPIYDTHPLLQLCNCGVKFESDKRTGLGDIDVDLYYNYDFCDMAMFELFFGVRFPTAGGSDSNRSGNPYRAHLGNGGHFEIKLGAAGAWQPLDWMGLKADAYWSFVLENTERRMATFCGSCVKNIGPCVKADVDWGYFVGRLDLQFFHPETSDISGVLGYEFYYKTEDHVNWKCKEVESCLGGKYTQDISPTGVVTNKKLVANPKALGKKEAERNTEQLSHKIRTEANYRLSKYMDLYAGASFVFAGQNAPRECDLHAGWNVRF